MARSVPAWKRAQRLGGQVDEPLFATPTPVGATRPTPTAAIPTSATSAPANRARAIPTSATPTPAMSRSSVQQPRLGRGKGAVGLGGKGKGRVPKRHAKILRDTIQGITKGAIRRLARRGGVKRISSLVYDDIRVAMKEFLTDVMRDAINIIDCCGRKTICVTDVIWALQRRGTPIYGYDPAFARK